jgi:NAD(P)-dependent dehydrogenase (short-subunit alcohol dehydrogenase family)
MSPLGASKAAVNYLTRKLHREHDDLSNFSQSERKPFCKFLIQLNKIVVFLVCPGPVDTDASKIFTYHSN